MTADQKWHDIQVTAVCRCGVSWTADIATTRPQRYETTPRFASCPACQRAGKAEVRPREDS